MKYYHGPGKAKKYFEGFYFKITDSKNTLAIIPGISISKQQKKAFIQLIINENSYNFDFPFEDFSAEKKNLDIKIEENHFTSEYLTIKLKTENVTISGTLIFGAFLPPKKDIMGPFRFLLLPCYHGIISMKHTVSGTININGEKISFETANGYLEKDYGYSFPKTYLWLQANSFSNPKLSLTASIANFPVFKKQIKGFFAILKTENDEYIFATYNCARSFQSENEITFKRGKMVLIIQYTQLSALKLFAPQNGVMETIIQESITSKIKVKLFKDEKLLIADESGEAGVEIKT